MSADTITTALFLITAVIAAGVLINAVYPVVYNMAGTFTSATHDSDQRLRTDFKIILITANGGTKVGTAWMKNVGSAKIPIEEIRRSDVFCGAVGDFSRIDWNAATGDYWIAEIKETAGQENNFWDPGETLEVRFLASKLPSNANTQAYFQFVLPNGVMRSQEFTVN
nr:flagellin [uncultured Methanoregula sp.]